MVVEQIWHSAPDGFVLEACLAAYATLIRVYSNQKSPKSFMRISGTAWWYGYTTTPSSSFHLRLCIIWSQLLLLLFLGFFIFIIMARYGGYKSNISTSSYVQVTDEYIWPRNRIPYNAFKVDCLYSFWRATAECFMVDIHRTGLRYIEHYSNCAYHYSINESPSNIPWWRFLVVRVCLHHRSNRVYLLVRI